jgi:hypothetical protein
MIYKEIFGALAVIVGILGFYPYIRDVYKGKTKPHLFSWILWGILETTAFFATLSKGAGPGAWVLGFSALVVWFIAFKALTSGEKNIVLIDWIGFVGAILGITMWIVTKDPFASAIIITITDALAYVPTYRKGYQRPNEETLAEYVASFLKQGLGLVALNSYNLVTVLYPASLVVTNLTFTIMVWMRRKHLNIQ